MCISCLSSCCRTSSSSSPPTIAPLHGIHLTASSDDPNSYIDIGTRFAFLPYLPEFRVVSVSSRESPYIGVLQVMLEKLNGAVVQGPIRECK